MDCSPPDFSVHGISQAGILEWVAISFSKAYSQLRDRMPSPALQVGSFTMGTSLVAQLVKNLPAMWETWVQSLGWKDPLEKGKATHSSILA